MKKLCLHFFPCWNMDDLMEGKLVDVDVEWDLEGATSALDNVWVWMSILGNVFKAFWGCRDCWELEDYLQGFLDFLGKVATEY
jgi:hypothetical protein